VVIEEEYAPHLALLSLDEGQMKQVFLNLITNAVQAMPQGGRLRVSTVQMGDEVVVAVSDSGVGIPPEALDRIFDPFFTTKPTGQGTGLGLSVSLGIVREHSGRITVESQAGRGSTLQVWLPAATARQQ
jgi:two-component system NtrC family sensor kinase